MNRGVIALARGIFEHPFFRDEPFTEREAWIWMLESAVWKPTEVHVRNGSRRLTRGQLAYSARYMANRWKWQEPRVRRFLGRLKNDAMVDVRADAHTTVVTICNYDRWQAKLRSADAVIDAPGDGQTTQI